MLASASEVCECVMWHMKKSYHTHEWVIHWSVAGENTFCDMTFSLDCDRLRCDITQVPRLNSFSLMWHDSFSWAWHDSLALGRNSSLSTWLILFSVVFKKNLNCGWQDSFTYGTRLKFCDMTHSYLSDMTHSLESDMTPWRMWRYSSSATRRIIVWDTPYWYVHHDTFPWMTGLICLRMEKVAA